jgi:hypothetical protein
VGGRTADDLIWIDFRPLH